jgi:hypothetical protein
MPPASRSKPASKPAAKSHSTEFEMERETKGAVRFQETPLDDGEAHVRSIYFRKELWEQLGKPEVISMTIAAVTD